ncbi:MAG: peptidoglycan editing factor PgeF [Chloracidobacterium sp.]|uniref:Purine nucleoside phosphorylase n=1 Tax=Chloracidobacterium validum TaxID=2821543 RepID=A0ABX8BA03_9BACT|nr:peptidoglycan editing factor PgeF [Chloracidobacterium validum]QUW03762.1 peptidoglycan editing factor PgeF [Chloracidobacterium validum]
MSNQAFSFRRQGEVAVLVCLPLEAAGFRHGFSTRLGGVSPLPSNALNLGYFAGDAPEHVTENRRRFLAVLDETEDRLQTLRQVHGHTVHTLDAVTENEAEPRSGDAWVGQDPARWAAVYTADCQAVLIGCSRTGAFAAVHAGWRGTLARIVEHTVARLRADFGARPEDLQAALGPAASVDHYEVGDEVVEAFHQAFPTKAAQWFKRPPGASKFHLDIPKANQQQLVEAGLRPERIYASGWCTMARTDLFFSYRRERGRHPVGRLVAAIGRPTPATP